MIDGKANMTFDELVLSTVEELDSYIQLINNTYNEETGGEDPENKDKMRHVLKLCNIVNNWLRMINAPEEQLYDI